jgi:hypothetical protein
MVGASKDPHMRAQCLQNSHSFYMHVVATFRHLGHLKTPVYNALRYCRVDGPSREWYNCSLADVLHIVARLVREGGETQSDDGEE